MGHIRKMSFIYLCICLTSAKRERVWEVAGPFSFISVWVCSHEDATQVEILRSRRAGRKPAERELGWKDRGVISYTKLNQENI